MGINLHKSEVIENIKLNDKFNHLIFELKDLFEFKTGQFVNLKVGKNIFRSYSIFSNPNKLPLWEMFVDVTPGGPGTTFIKGLKAGDIIETTRAVGSFILEEGKNPDSLMIATGCGIAPLKPMMEQSLSHKNQNIRFIWGLRKESEICCLDLLEELSKNGSFKFEIVLSQPEKKWKGKTGHITDYLSALTNFKKDTQVYIAGNGNFVKDAIEVLVKAGISEENIFFEQCYFGI